jgi:hypothetical protein
MSINEALQLAIMRSGFSKTAICHRLEGLRMTPWRLSKIIHGTYEATPEEKKALAKILKTSVRAIFQAEEPVAS